MKKMISLVLTVGMGLSLLSGCQNKEQIPESSPVSENKDTQQENTGETTAQITEMSEITVTYPSFVSYTGLAEVEAAINEITEAQINTQVHLSVTDVANYSQQLQLSLTSGEALDLFATVPIPAASFTNLSSQGYMMDMTELLDTYGTDIKNNLGELLSGTTVDGEILGVCGYRALAMNWYVCMRTDILEELGLLEKAQNMTTYAELEEILAEVTEKTDLAGISCESYDGTILAAQNGMFVGDRFADGYAYDSLGDATKAIMCIDGQVSNYFANADYKAMQDMVHDWYEKGYVYKDTATTEEGGGALVQNNVIFSFITGTEVGVEATKSASCGMDMTCVKILDGAPISTSSTTRFTWCIPNSSKEPEAAMKFLNLMYSNEDICNLLCWGLEGRDYVVEDGIAKYPEGVNESSVAYHQNDFLFGNQFLTLPWDGSDADIREKGKEELDNIGESPYLGFSCNTENITNEISAVTNTINEYRKGLESGATGTEQYEAFLDKLEDSGIQKIVDEYQAQLDAWLENQ